MAYANMRLIDELCAGEPYALHTHGYEEDLAQLTAADLYEYYQTMLTEDRFDIYVLGEINASEVEEKVSQVMSEKQITSPVTAVEAKPNSVKEKPQTIIEKQTVQQAYLHFGFRTNSTFRDNSYFAFHVFNGLLGGFPNSKLFLNVREKHSLAYYAASRIESHHGLLFVFSGIEVSNYEKAQTIIAEQFAEMKAGHFTEQEVAETKGLIISELKETMDSPYGMIELLYQQVVGNKEFPPDLFIERIQQVTREDVINVAKKIELDTVYLLTNEEGEGK